MNCCSECQYYDYCYDDYHDFVLCLIGNDRDFRQLEDGQHIPL